MANTRDNHHEPQMNAGQDNEALPMLDDDNTKLGAAIISAFLRALDNPDFPGRFVATIICFVNARRGNA